MSSSNNKTILLETFHEVFGTWSGAPPTSSDDAPFDLFPSSCDVQSFRPRHTLQLFQQFIPQLLPGFAGVCTKLLVVELEAETLRFVGKT